MINIYTVSDCKNCKKAKTLLDKLNISYEEINLKEPKNRDARSYYRSLGVKTAPVIVSVENGNEEWILVEYDEESLISLIKENRNG